MGLRSAVHREYAAPEVWVALPAAGDLGGQRTGGPGVHDIGVAHEPARLAALGFGETGRRVAARVDGQVALLRAQDCVVARVACVVQGVPHRNRYPEESLARHEPVAVEAADPVLVAHLHVGWVPVDLLASGDEAVAELRVASAIGDVPLTGRDDLERLVALLEELHRVGDGPRLAHEGPAGTEDLDHALLGGVAGRADDGLVVRDPVGGRDPRWHVREDPSVPTDDRTRRQLKLAPPRHVGEVAEGADHCDARALLGIGERMGDNRDLDPECRSDHRRTEQWLVTLVIRVRDERDARGKEFGPGGLDVDDRARIRRGREADAMVRARSLPVLELGLRDGGLEGDVPQGRRLRLVGLAAREVAQERELAHALGVLVDRLVRLRPVDRQAHAAPEILEDHLVLDRESLAQLDEVLARDRYLLLGIGLGWRLERRVVGQARIASHAEVVLHPALSRQAVVVPAHGVEHLEAAHALVARHAVGVGVREHVAHVQRPAHGRRGSVDRVHLLAGLRPIERVEAGGLPDFSPLRLDAVEGGLFGDGIGGVHEGSSYLALRPRLLT
ncbi:unannotated protein [freshwater metagenome]|uniref:Unannotated protein n=1 Tax=freshwater metagenome TaxID=449393 RepID=A0A6J7CQN2_9ZZZZ